MTFPEILDSKILPISPEWNFPFVSNGTVHFQKLLSVIFSFSFKQWDPDQTPRSPASDLGLHCLHMPNIKMLGLDGLRCFVNCIGIINQNYS